MSVPYPSFVCLASLFELPGGSLWKGEWFQDGDTRRCRFYLFSLKYLFSRARAIRIVERYPVAMRTEPPSQDRTSILKQDL